MGKRSMLTEGLLLLCVILLALHPSASSAASVKVQNVVSIPPYQSPPCNAAHPNNCPKPVNRKPSEHCNEANRCRTHLMFYQTGSGNQFLAELFVEGGPANLTGLVLTEAITTVISRWLVNNTKDKTSQQLRISINAIGDGHPLTSAQLQYAASQGIHQAGLNFELASTPASDSTRTNKEASFDPFYANITITDTHPGKAVMFEFSTIAKGLGEADVNGMMKPVPDMFHKLWLKATRM